MIPKLRYLLAGTAFVAAGLVSTACHVHDHDDPYEEHGLGYYTTIDSDYVLDTTLGEGAGVFVEYERGGLWTVWTSCDTALYGALCTYSVSVFSHAPIDTIDELDVEDYDHVEYYGDSSFTFYAETGNASDMVQFTTEPGALVEMEVVLDGVVAPERFVWYGNDYVHDGAPQSPVVFQPDAP